MNRRMLTMPRRAVLYATDLEPLTVVDLSRAAWHRLLEGGRWAMVVDVPYTFESARYDPATAPSATARLLTVEIWGERLARGGHESLMLFTDHDEAALLLRAAFLPGQHRTFGRAVDQARARAFAEGFTKALRYFGD